MSPRGPETDLRSLWQNLEGEGSMVSVEQIRLKAREFLRKNRRDLIARFAFALIASVFCGFVMLNSRWTSVRVFAVLVMAMLLVSAGLQLYRSYRRGATPLTGGTNEPWSSCLGFYRSELEKQQAFGGQPVWQMVAAVLVIAWLTPGALDRSSTDPLRIVLPAVLFAAVGLIVLMAVRKVQARRFEGDIEALNRFEKESHPGGADDIAIRE